MAQKKKKKNKAKGRAKESSKKKYPVLTSRLKRWMMALMFFVLTAVLGFAFADKAGQGGRFLSKDLGLLIGRAMFFVPILFLVSGILLLRPDKKRLFAPLLAALALFILGVSGILGIQMPQEMAGGWLGHIAAWPLLNYFGSWVALTVFLALIVAACLIIWEFTPAKHRFSLAKVFSSKNKAVLSGPAALPEVMADKKTQKGDEEPKFKIKPVKVERQSIASEPSIKSEKRTVKKETRPAVEQESSTFQALFDKNYKAPPLRLLKSLGERPSTGDIERNLGIIQNTLGNFGISVEMGEVNVGPTVTQYTLKPAEGIRLTRIISLSKDLALALAAHPVRIEAPIPGRSLVGVEVPNKQRAKVMLKEVLDSDVFKQSSSRLSLALGRDVAGNPVVPDLAKMPHLLVAGATGSGKTICLQAIILSLLFRNSPQILRLILVDPKRVEFPAYDNLPHLLAPVVYNAQKTVNILNWLVGEMERRFDLLAELGARDIASFNQALAERPELKQDFYLMPYIVFIIDELADLMAVKGREIEAGIVRLSQLARAVGIHLVVATQRPSVEVITGLIKANITSRIAFQVASQVDSRTILDMSGAEALLGSGDMLFISSESSKPRRVQGPFVSQQEVRNVTQFIKKNNALDQEEPSELRQLEQELDQETGEPGTGLKPVAEEEEEPLLPEAKKVILDYDRASASLLQRRLRVGYARAARILDILEREGIVGPAEGSKPREVLIHQAADDQERT